VKLCFLVLTLLASAALGADLSGRITDPAKRVIRDAKVLLTNRLNGASSRATTTLEGAYSFPALAPGRYDLEISKEGFRTAVREDIRVNVAGRIVEDIELSIGEVRERVTVEGQFELIDRETATVETVIDRAMIEALPLNGRSFQSLIELTPGVVMARASIQNPGQFSINGQRTNGNLFMVDGVSANVSASMSATYSQQASGTLPALTAFGGTNGLVSQDALEEFRVQTSTFSPEYGRQPGGQISLVTRSGTKDLHFSLFEYFRNDKLDANDWFSNSRAQRRLPLRQNQFGGTVGGPVWIPKLYDGRESTFFFASYEGQRLVQPQASPVNVLVPSLESRQSATGVGKQIVDAFPLPTAPALAGDPAGFARYVRGVSFPSRFDATSVKLDHRFGGSTNAFFRWNSSPSRLSSPAFANQFNQNESNLATYTAGLTTALGPAMSNDLRLNYSRADGEFDFVGREIGGAVLPPRDLIFPPSVDAERMSVSLNLVAGAAGTTSLTQGRSLGNVQRQFNLVDTFSLTRGTHQFKFGFDWRRLMPIAAARERGITYSFGGNIANILAGQAASVSIQALAPVTDFVISNYSFFAQDTWRVRSSLSITYGLRYELNPAPNGELLPYTFDQVDNLRTAVLAPPNTRQWNTDRVNLAPRVGIAWQVPGVSSMVVRTGFGVFFDTGNGPALRGYSSFPFNATRSLTNVNVPVDPAQLNLTFNTNPPYSSQFFVFPRNLQLPYTMQYNFSVEKGLGRNQSISFSYVGAQARKLLRMESVRNVAAGAVIPETIFLNPTLFTTSSVVNITRNGSSSNYNALQAQFQRRMVAGVGVIASYTWSKSLDDASDEATPQTPGNFAVDVLPGRSYGPSDFDVRQVFTGAITWSNPVRRNGFVGGLLNDWAVDTYLRFRSGLPFNITTTSADVLNSVVGARRVDYIGGPVWRDDPNVATGRRLNAAAFAIPAARTQGSLGRNALRSPASSQVDLSVSRSFRLKEQLRFTIRAEAFNVLNHANFGVPNSAFPSGTFGIIESTLGRSLGAGGTSGGFNPLYQAGGPRSMQLVGRLQW